MLGGVALGLIWAGVEFRLGKLTDGNGVPLSSYAGVYGFRGGIYVQAVIADGWVIVHAVDSRGGWCEIGRPARGGLAMGPWPSRRLPDSSLDDDPVWLAPDGSALHFSHGAYPLPRRPPERPKLASMWNLDGKSGRLSPCAPGALERFELLRLALGS